MTYDLTSLRLFVAVAEELNLTKAAEREHLALSTVSKRITDLEDTFGSVLLDRHARGVTLTTAGSVLLHYARQVIQMLHRLQGELSEYATGIKGHIRVYANSSSIIEFLPRELNTFFGQYPQVKIDLEEQVSSVIVRAVTEGTADIGIIAGNTPAPGLQIFSFRTDRLAVVVSESHPLAHRKSVRLTEVLDFDFVLPGTDSSLYALIVSTVAAADQSIKARIHGKGFDGICRMIRANLGIGILPVLAIEPELQSNGLCAIPLNEEWALRHLQLVVRDFDSLHVSARRLVQHLSPPPAPKTSFEAKACLANDQLWSSQRPFTINKNNWQ